MDVATALTWITFIGMGVLGVSAVIGYFDKDKRAKNKEENDVEDRLIKLFKEQIEQLERKVSDLEKKTEAQQQTITVLETKSKTVEDTNQMLKDILMGRDEDSVAFRDKAIEAINKVDANTRKIDRIENGNKEILKSINSLYTLINKHLENERKMLEKI